MMPVAGKWLAGLLVLAALLLLPGGRLAAQKTAAVENGTVSTARPVQGFWRPRDETLRKEAVPGAPLRFLTADDYPPFNYLDPVQRLKGFNVDLVKALCAEMKVKCTIKAAPWEDLEAALLDGSADVLAAGNAITAAALEKMDFTAPYFRMPARFAMQKGRPPAILSRRTLRDLKVAVVNNSSHEAYLKAAFPEISRVTYPDDLSAFTAMQDGKVVAVFADGVKLMFWLKGEASAGCCELRGGPYTESRFFGPGMAMAVGRGRISLARFLDAGLARLYRKGIYARLYRLHFPLDLY
jgi:polar amino acid transport system substrate-binding protein